MKKILFLLSLSLLLFSCGNEISENASDLKDKSGKYNLIAMDGENISSEGFILELDGENQRISGKMGCNNFVAAYEVKGEKLNFQPALGTKMYCEGKMEYEEKFGEILSEITKVKISEEELVFLSEGNEALLKLKKQEDSE